MKIRSDNAIRAALRTAGPMKHRNAPRGGDRAEERDLIAEALAELAAEAEEEETD